jgi:hypothetical protein
MLRSALSCFLLLLLALPVHAAEPAEAPPEAANDTAGEPTPPEDIDAALAEEIRAAEEAAATTPPADANEPFVPTVQISEDLSVSFPVDI